MIIFLNGPPGAGKDTAATIIRDCLTSCVDYKISSPLKLGIASCLQINGDIIRACKEDKDVPANIFNGHTYRELQISLYKDFFLKNFPETILADIAVRRLKLTIAKYITISDAGMTQELKVIQDHFGHNKCALLEIDRPKHTFEGDIRQWIDPDMSFKYRDKIVNKHDKELYKIQITRVLQKWGCLLDD